jgi:rod shape-determining protein MreD
MKKKFLFYFLFIILSLLLQTTLLQYMEIYGVKPNLLVVFVITVALLRGSEEGGAVGLFAGLAADLMFGGVLGFYALFGFYLGIAVGTSNKRLFKENLLIAVFFTFVYSVAYESVIYIVNNIMSVDMGFLYAFTRIILPEAAYNSLAAVLIFPLVIRADRWFKEKDKLIRRY